MARSTTMPRSLAADAAPTGSTALLARVIFGVALFGILLVVHLWLQARGTAVLGCSEADAGCGAVTSSAYAQFLGVPQVAWGLLFYVLVAALRFGYGATGSDRLRQASGVVVGTGLLYSAYLVYLQAAVLDSFCALCLTSAATVTLLAILHLMEHLRLRTAAPVSSRAAARRANLRPYALLAGLFAVLAGADVVFSGGGEAGALLAADGSTPTAPAGTPGEPGTSGVPRSPTAECRYDPAIAPIDMARWTTGPFLGAADAPVRVVKFFDPNCPHCKHLHEMLEATMPRVAGRARIYYVPYPIWEFSFGQVQAMRLAAAEGKYYEMIDAQMDAQQQGGLSVDQLAAIAGEIGMNATTFREQLVTVPDAQDILAQRSAISDAGLRSFPKMVVEGRTVLPPSSGYSADCFVHFVDEAFAAGPAVAPADTTAAAAPPATATQ